LGKSESEIQHIALVTLEGHQRAIMGSMTVEEIYKDRKKFSKQVFEVASSDLVNMGITVVSYTLKDIRDEEVSLSSPPSHHFNFNYFFLHVKHNFVINEFLSFF
jgi:flotillin